MKEDFEKEKEKSGAEFGTLGFGNGEGFGKFGEEAFGGTASDGGLDGDANEREKFFFGEPKEDDAEKPEEWEKEFFSDFSEAPEEVFSPPSAEDFLREIREEEKSEGQGRDEREHDHAMLKKHAGHAHTALEEGDIEALTSEDGKIYLPQPAPPSEAEKIQNPDGYIRNRFKELGVGKVKKKGKFLLVAAGIVMAAVSLWLLTQHDPAYVLMYIFFFAMGATVFLLGLPLSYTEQAEAPEKYRLIFPYAVEKIPAAEGGKEYFLGLWYVSDIGQRLARTKVLSGEKVNRLISAFLRGELVAAARSAAEADKAVVLAPGDLGQ